MIPVPIPDGYPLAPWQRRLVVGPPDADPTGDIRAVEAIAELVDLGDGRSLQFRVLIEIERDDWRAWGVEPPAAPARFWLVQVTSQMVPFAIEAAGIPPGPGHDTEGEPLP